MIQFKSAKKITQKSAALASEALQKVLARKDLGFHQLPNRDSVWSASEKMATELQARGDELVILGMGGSALGGRCITSSVGDHGRVKYLFDSDPISLENVLADRARLRQAQFLIISKSGNTLEVNCMIDILQARLKDLGRELKTAAAVISEEGQNPLWSWAESHGLWREAHPTDVGGRYSALTPVGLVPAAFARVNLSELREGARAALKNHKLIQNISAFYYESFLRREQISVFWFYLESLHHFGPWLEQLWAESLGKKIYSKRTDGKRTYSKKISAHKKTAMAASSPLILSGTGDQHSVLQQLMEDPILRSVCFVRTAEYELMGPALTGNALKGFEYLQGQNLGHVFSVQSKSTQAALAKAERTTASLEVERLNAQTLGELLLTFELVVGTLGEMLGLNAFDQPGVEIGKKITKEKLQKSSRH